MLYCWVVLLKDWILALNLFTPIDVWGVLRVTRWPAFRGTPWRE